MRVRAPATLTRRLMSVMLSHLLIIKTFLNCMLFHIREGLVRNNRSNGKSQEEKIQKEFEKQVTPVLLIDETNSCKYVKETRSRPQVKVRYVISRCAKYIK